MSAPSIARGSTAPRLREGRAPVRERLMVMLFLMALLHAIIILGVGFSSSARGSGGEVPQLDVMLVTTDVPEARSNRTAAYLSQRTQIGAGDTDAQQPGSPASRGAQAAADEPLDGDDPSAHTGSGRSAEERLLATTGASPDIRYFGEIETSSAQALPEMLGELPGAPRSGRGDAVQLLLRGKSSAQHWVSPDTQASVLAPYLAEWKRKVERVGTLNFPSAARRAGLSGSPVVEVEIAANGRLRDARVRRSSGYGALDQAALTILRLASPFNPFPADLAAEYSRLRFAYQWDFEAGTLTSATVPVATAAPSSSGSAAAPGAAPVAAPAEPPAVPSAAAQGAAARP
ncbi:MAG TPA: energy transducer TonB [Steroidobacteraceae bacterium]|nr:energy transducer TonB [Steroidobacteraceae bacterium]